MRVEKSKARMLFLSPQWGRIKASSLALCLLLFGLGSHPFTAGSQEKEKAPDSVAVSPFILGETVEFSSAVLGERRRINVYFPKGYDPDSLLTYPVIYLLDGSADEDFIPLCGLVQFLSFPWVGALPPTLVVGIANVDRRRDFTFPTRVEEDRKAFPTTGQSASFIEFLERELIPLVDGRYPVNQSRALVGQSLGGLLASEILVDRPELFSRYYIVSPSLWWDRESLLDRPLNTEANRSASVFLAVGKEGKNMVRPARRWARKLREFHPVDFRYYRKFDHGNLLHQALYDAFSNGIPQH